MSLTKNNNKITTSILGPSAVIIGNVGGTADFEIRGRVQGDIRVNGRIFVAEAGIVVGNIDASEITVAGEVQGHLSCQDAIVIQASGTVEGSIRGVRVAIEAGARVRGTLATGTEATESNIDPTPPAERPETSPTATIERPPSPFPAARVSPQSFVERPRPSENSPRPEAVTDPKKATPPSAKKQRRGKNSGEGTPSKERASTNREPRAKGSASHFPEATTSTDGAESTNVDPKAMPSIAKRTPTTTQVEDSAENTHPTTSVKKSEIPTKEHSEEVAPSTPRQKKPRRRGPPKVPTFRQGVKGHKRA